MKKQKTVMKQFEEESPPSSFSLSLSESLQPQQQWCLFDLLSEEIMFTILDLLEPNSLDKKSFSLVSKTFHRIESRHRKSLKPLRSHHLPSVLRRYPYLSHLDLTLCPRVTDASLSTISSSAVPATLRSLDLSRSRCYTSNGLLGLATSCLNLVELDLSNATEMRDECVAAVAEAKNLERLWLGRCKLMTDMGVGCIAVGCRKLKLLCLKWCLGVGDLGVGLVAVKCTQMQTLDLSYLPITGKSLSSVSQLPYLEDLILEGCFGIDDESLGALKNGCESLKTLDVSGCQNISYVGLSLITSGSEGLQHLTLAHGSSVTFALASSLKKFSSLQSIKLDGCLVNCAGLKAIGDFCVSLSDLSLSKCSGVTDEGLSYLTTKQRQLRKLDITCSCKITEISLGHITSSCTGLTSLRMESCGLVPPEAFVLIGQRCHSIEELDLTDNEIDDEGLEFIANCSNLSILKLGVCLKVTDMGLSYIGKSCSKLVELDLYRSSGITDFGISAISHGCPSLEMINISYCNEITDVSLMSLSKCSKLTILECRGCPLVTSLGLAAVAVGCRQLSKLDIKKCSYIDDAGMIPLSHFSQNLRRINLSYTSVTDVGLLCLANISCLQSMTILHLKCLTPSGLAAVSLACGGLVEVKLQACFKSLLPHPLLEHLTARGCVFHWRDKAFRAVIDPKCWKL